MAKLILTVRNTNEFADGPNYAFIDLNPSLAATILRRREIMRLAFLEDSSLTEMEYYSCAPIFLEILPESISEQLPDGVEDEPFTVVEAMPEDFEDVVVRTDCDRMVIRSDKMWWEAFPRGCDYKTETWPIPYSVVAEAAQEVKV